ncbi:MAG: hypothetical protein JW987_05430 [Anaerolineaceae bacterium]|nr:hypothetical protein [Anaerolineaceae bacterium]
MKLKIFSLLIVAYLLSACGVQAALNTNPDDVAGVAAEIVDFTAPAGYSPEFLAEINGYTVISYRPSQGNGHLYLLQSRDAADASQMEEALNEMNPGEKDLKARLTVLETRVMTVREQEATLVISEGTNGNGESYRQAALAFEGKSGPAMLVFSESLAVWDIATVEASIASVH